MKQRKPMGKFRALILSLLSPELFPAVAGREMEGDGSGPAVSEKNVLGLSAAWACTRLISETMATLPLSIYENARTGKRVATEHPLHFVVHDQPNTDSTSSLFWEAFVAAMMRGNAYAERLMIDDRLVGLSFLPPGTYTVQPTRGGGREMHVRNSRGEVRVLPWSKIWHVPGFSLDGRNGVSVIQYGAATFGTALAVQSATRGTFERGLHKTTALKMPGTLRADQRDDARNALGQLSGAINAGRSIVLEGDTDLVTVGIDPADAQMVEMSGFSVEEVCRWYRVPPFMVGHSGNTTMWGTGVESLMIGFLTFTLAPWLKRIEQGIKKDLLEPGNRYYAKYSVEGLLRADSAARAAFYSVMVNNGILTRDEVRALEDREPMGGNAAVLTVQTAMAPLDSLGQADDSTNARAALLAWLGHSPNDSN